MSNHLALDYDVEVNKMEGLNEQEAGLLQALSDDLERLKFFKEKNALQTALTLKVGTTVTVEEEGGELRGIIRFIGPLTKPLYPHTLSGTFFGIELQVRPVERIISLFMQIVLI